MMKETRKSLKNYFIFIGVVNALYAISLIIALTKAFNVINFLIVAILLTISTIFIYFGVNFSKFLDKKSKVLINFVLTVFILNAIFYLLAGNLIVSVISILLAIYLVRSIKRLSKTASVANPQV